MIRMTAIRMPILETARLIIRPFATSDLESCRTVLDGELGEGMSAEERQRWLSWISASHEELARLLQPPYGDRAIALRATGAIIGTCALVPSFGPFGQLPSRCAGRSAPEPARNEPEVGLSWALSPTHRGQGHATEAARALVDFARSGLGLRRVVATTEHVNHRSIRVMERLGMRIECNPLPEPAWFQVIGTLELQR